MSYHKLLLKQISKFLPENLNDNPEMNKFLSIISDSYTTLERDKELAERAFSISEEEHIELNKQLKYEVDVKKRSVEKLKEAVGTITGDDIQSDSDDLLMIARYLTHQVGKRKNAEKVFTSLITNMQSGILLEDETRHIVFTNQLFCNMFNIKAAPEMLQGNDCSNSAERSKMLFKNPEKFVSDIDKILSERKLVTEEILELADGQTYLRDFIPIYVENKYKGHLWSYTDITERKKVQDAIEQSELKNRMIMNSALDAIVTIDMAGVITFWNPQAEKVFGWREQEVLGKKLSETIIPALYRKDHEKGMNHYLKTGTGPVLNKQIELPAINNKGEEFLIELSIIPVKQGDSEFFCSFIRDISDRKKNEEELERLSLVASANENGVVFTNNLGKIFWCNEGFTKMCGYTHEEVIGKTPIELMIGPLSNREVLKKMVDDFLSSNSFTSDVIQYRKDGSWFWGRSKGQAIRNKHGEVNYFAIIENITHEKEVQRKLKEYEERLKLALTNVGDNYWEHNFKTGKTYFSNPGNVLLGYNIEEYPDGAALWWDRVHPDDKAILQENDEKYKQGLIDHHTNEYRVIHKDGTIQWVFDRGVVTEKDDKGMPVVIIGTHIDITQQKILELELTQAKNAAEASTRAKEMFLANMSHEIRTPMNAILGMTNQLSKTTLNKTQHFYLNTVQSAAENLLIIINDILDLTKIESGKLSLEKIGFEPKAVLARTMQVMMHRAEEKGIAFVNSFCDASLSPVLLGDPYRLNQVILNLVSNSIKFTKKGSVDITCSVISDTAEKQKVQLTVTDTGIGMDEEYIKKLFEKFSQEDDSTTRKYGGTGLGMSICKDLIELMGGEIKATSVKGEGTSVSFAIEFDKGTVADLPQKETAETDTSILADKKILITDDNEMNQLVAATILQNFGAKITQAFNGLEAVEQLKKSTFDIVLMDVQMPVMDGIEATKVIRETISKDLPIIALTAFAIKGDNQKCLDAGMNDYLSKPFEESQLLNIVSRWVGKTIPKKVKIEEVITIKTNDMPLYDLTQLNTLARGNKEFIGKMIALFIEQVPASVKEIQEAYEQKDFEKVKKTAHRIKPSIDTMGIESLKEEIREIEQSAEAYQTSPQLELLIKNLEKIITEVVSKLREEGI
jgi:PAS domain S-box-containing protein